MGRNETWEQMEHRRVIRAQNELGRAKHRVQDLRNNVWARHEVDLKALPEARKKKLRPLFNDVLEGKTINQLRLMEKKLNALHNEFWKAWYDREYGKD